MKNKNITKQQKIIDELLSGVIDEKYQGKQVVVIGEEVCILPENDEESVKLVTKLEKKYPGETPHLVFVPRPETYILTFYDSNGLLNIRGSPAGGFEQIRRLKFVPIRVLRK